MTFSHRLRSLLVFMVIISLLGYQYQNGSIEILNQHRLHKITSFSQYKQKSDEFHKLFKDIPADERLLVGKLPMANDFSTDIMLCREWHNVVICIVL